MRVPVGNRLPTTAPTSPGCRAACNQQPPYHRETAAPAAARGRQCLQAEPSRRGLLTSSALLSGLATVNAFVLPRESAAKVVRVEVGELGERGVQTLASGVQFAELEPGSGEVPRQVPADRQSLGSLARTGDLVVAQITGSLEDGTVFLDTRSEGTVLAFELGIETPIVTEGLAEVLSTMHSGGRRLAVVPPALGYGDAGAKMPLKSVPRNAPLYYDVELLRCESTSLGLACCTEKDFPCPVPDVEDLEAELDAAPAV